MTKKGVPNVLASHWSGDCQEDYERLRSELISGRVLRIPTIGTPFVLHTDASGKAVGATLGELDDQGVEQPLAFASQKPTATHMAWATIQREAYAIIWALNRFRDIDLRVHFL